MRLILHPILNLRHAVPNAVLVLAVCGSLGIAHAEDVVPSVVSTESFNLKILKQSDAEISVAPALKGSTHNWFAGQFQNLPTGHEITLAVDMKGQDTKLNRADVSKWNGLRPLLTYADPTRYESYFWYWKDLKGVWHRADPLIREAEQPAGNGATPKQDAIPEALAAQFLSDKGTRWHPWREIESATADTANNIFRIRCKFERPTASVAMRMPYSYTFEQQFIEHLQKAKLPGVFVDEIGTTRGGRKLQVIRLEPLAPKAGEARIIEAAAPISAQERPTALLIAREHATEHAGSWAIHGALLELIAETSAAHRLRRDMTWLIVLIEDPDGVADALFDPLTEKFRDPHNPNTPPEVFAYTRYLVDYVNKGRTLDLTVSIHNVECNEGQNLFSPFASADRNEITQSFNSGLMKRLRDTGYMVGGDQSQGEGCSPFRLYAWAGRRFGALDLAYEVNDRLPQKRLAFWELQGIGAVLSHQIGDWCLSRAGREWHQVSARATLKQRETDRAAYLKGMGPASPRRAAYDLLTLGY